METAYMDYAEQTAADEQVGELMRCACQRF